MNSVLRLSQRFNRQSFSRVSTYFSTFQSQKSNSIDSRKCSQAPHVTGTLKTEPGVHTQLRLYSSSPTSDDSFNQPTYEHVCSETLEGLNEYFEELVESEPEFKEADVTYGDGVLTVRLGGSFGTYVINRQSPNKQIWLSSPISGPKRYDFVVITAGSKTGNGTKGYWLYKDDVTLHDLLQKEISAMVKGPVEFLELPFGGKN